MKLKTRLEKLLLTIAVLMGCLQAKGQQMQAALSHYSTDEGLASNTIADIVVDDYGYVWVGSWNGLSRFDGFSFFNYATGNASGIPLLHNRILDMYIDHSQNIWLRMYDGRIFVLNRPTDTIVNPLQHISGYQNFKTRHRLYVSQDGWVYAIIEGVGIYKMRLENSRVQTQLIKTGDLKPNFVVEGYKGSLWAATTRGLHQISRSKNELEQHGFVEDEVIRCVHSDGYGIYMGTRSGKIICYKPGQEPEVIAELQIPISSIFADSQGLIWFSQDVQGISRLNPKTGNIKSFQQQVLVPQYDVRGAVIKEVNNTVWVSMNHGGFGYYNRETDQMEFFHNDPSNPWNLSNTVYAFQPMTDGIIWESTSRRGLEKLEILKNTIVRKKLFDNETGFSNEIRAIYYDKERKKLLIGNKANTLAIFSADGSRTDLHGDGKGNQLGRIYGINKDRKGNYWLSCKGNGVIKLTPVGNAYQMTFFHHEEGNPNSLNDDNAYNTVEDRQGNIWVGTYGGGVNILMPNGKGGYRVLNPQNGGINHYPKDTYMKIRNIALDKQDNVWVGTTDGLLIMSMKKGKEPTVTIVENSEHADYNMESDDIVCMACAPDNSMWIGTNGGGLSHTVGKDDDGNWMFETFTTRDGLPSEEIKSITFNKDGHIWLATDHNLCSFNTATRIFSSFTLQDGVDNTICSECGAFAMPNNNVLFGTVDGYYIVDHQKITAARGSQLKLRITDFLIDNVTMSPRLNDEYTYYVPDSSFVELPAHGSTFTFRFASLNHQLQHRVHYQYMLEGYDTEWHNADKSRTATYTGLPAGTYEFKVKAFLLESDGDHYDIRTISVKVPPYWLLSSTAVWIYVVLLALGLLVFIFVYQERRKKERVKHVLRVGQRDVAFDQQEKYEFMKRQIDWLEKHYTDTNLRYDDMIAQSALGRAAYYNELESLTGLSPKDFVTDFRLKKAIELVRQTRDELTLSDIANKVGFSDPIFFNRAFKQKTGLSPIAYWEQLQKAES